MSEDWAEMLINDEKVGYLHTLLERAGETIIGREVTYMQIGRGPSAIETMSTTTTRESLDGQPLSMVTFTREGSRTKTQRIEFTDTGANVSTNDGIRSWTREVNLTPGFFLNWGFVRALEKADLAPGESWSCQMYAPDIVLDQLLPTTTTLLGEEERLLEGVEQKILKFEQVLQIGFLPLTVTASTLKDGRLLHLTMPLGGMTITMIGSTEERARASFSPPDLFTDTLIPLNRSIPDDATTTTFLIRSTSGTEKNLPKSATQSVEELPDATTRVTVQRGQLGSETESIRPVDEAFLQPSPLVDFEDPAILALLKGKDLEGLNFAEKTKELVRIVDNAVAVKSMDLGFATASETAALREGDCTEHALLLAAVSRASGIPSRGATGVVFFLNEEAEPFMGYHMWNQLWDGSKWVDVDAAFGTAEPAPIRILFGTSDLSDPVMAEEILNFARFLGQTEIEVESVH